MFSLARTGAALATGSTTSMYSTGGCEYGCAKKRGKRLEMRCHHMIVRDSKRISHWLAWHDVDCRKVNRWLSNAHARAHGAICTGHHHPICTVTVPAPVDKLR
jgi:hypothetical protein